MPSPAFRLSVARWLTADFCHSVCDKTPTSINPTRASRSIAAGTSSTPQTAPNISRKLIEKCYSQNQYSLLFVTSKKQIARRFPLRFLRRRDKNTQFCRLSAIFQHSRQNSRFVFRRANMISRNQVAKTKRQSDAGRNSFRSLFDAGSNGLHADLFEFADRIRTLKPVRVCS